MTMVDVTENCDGRQSGLKCPSPGSRGVLKAIKSVVGVRVSKNPSGSEDWLIVV